MASLTSKIQGALPNVTQSDKIDNIEKDIVNLETYKIKGLTTDFGSAVSDTDTWLKVSNGGTTGPSLLEDHVGREKIHRFDHERIPERVVHARGTGAHGHFRVFDDRAKKYTTAGVLTDAYRVTPTFVRFSTVQGSRGSAVRDRLIWSAFDLIMLFVGHCSRRPWVRS